MRAKKLRRPRSAASCNNAFPIIASSIGTNCLLIKVMGSAFCFVIARYDVSCAGERLIRWVVREVLSGEKSLFV